MFLTSREHGNIVQLCTKAGDKKQSYRSSWQNLNQEKTRLKCLNDWKFDFVAGKCDVLMNDCKILLLSSWFIEHERPITIKIKHYCSAFKQLFQLPPRISPWKADSIIPSIRIGISQGRTLKKVGFITTKRSIIKADPPPPAWTKEKINN